MKKYICLGSCRNREYFHLYLFFIMPILVNFNDYFSDIAIYISISREHREQIVQDIYFLRKKYSVLRNVWDKSISWRYDAICTNEPYIGLRWFIEQSHYLPNKAISHCNFCE